MKTKMRARWNVTPQEATHLQQIWRERVETQDRYGPLQYVAGVLKDVSCPIKSQQLSVVSCPINSHQLSVVSYQ